MRDVTHIDALSKAHPWTIPLQPLKPLQAPASGRTPLAALAAEGASQNLTEGYGVQDALREMLQPPASQ